MISLPFALPERPAVRQLRQQPTVAAHPNKRTQPLAGFEDRFTDIVDYIVRITDEIWIDRGIGYIYDTYDKNCTIYSTYGVVRSIEEVVAGTVTTLNGYPDGEILSKILQRGPVTVIKKPIELEQLNRTVKQLGHKGMESAS